MHQAELLGIDERQKGGQGRSIYIELQVFWQHPAAPSPAVSWWHCESSGGEGVEN